MTNHWLSSARVTQLRRTQRAFCHQFPLPELPSHKLLVGYAITGEGMAPTLVSSNICAIDDRGSRAIFSKGDLGNNAILFRNLWNRKFVSRRAACQYGRLRTVPQRLQYVEPDEGS